MAMDDSIDSVSKVKSISKVNSTSTSNDDFSKTNSQVS
jgi:hypothetical protein